MYVYTYIHIATTNEKRDHVIKEMKEGYMERFGGRKAKEK